MYKAVLSVLSVGLLCLGMGSAQAYLYEDNPDPCEDYALKGVSQYAIAKQLRCPVSGLRWNHNQQGQAQWCKTARPEIVLGETQARAETLLRCLGNPAPLNPNDLTKVSNQLGEEMIQAVARDNISRVMQLVASGWSMEFEGNAGNDGRIAYVAIVAGAEQSARFFIDKLKMNPNGASNGGASGLYYLIQRPTVNYRLLEYLLQHRADPNSMGEGVGELPLHAAVERRDLRAAQLLLKYGANANADHAGCLGASPLSRAVQLGDMAMVRLLKQHGASEQAGCQ